MPLVSWHSRFAAAAAFWCNYATAFTGSEYRLSHEYSGTNFFDGWDFYSGRDPTGGFVTYYSRSSAQLTDLIRSSETGPAYMGVNYIDKLPFNNETGRGDGAGRPSVRIASKQAFTHGLFVGDFEHIPAGICGTWPAFWTLGPNWPYTGEVDILEGVNANSQNVMSLHTNETCIIEGDNTVMTGRLENTNCAYYPDYNVGCGVSDPRQTSFGVGFNQAGGGVYAMQWTSEYIRIWHWPRNEVPSDLDSKQPDPSSWGLPAAQLGVGNCTIDQHFQSHKIIFDTTFCGEYAGNQYVWNTNDESSCKASTGLATCDNFVANNPAAFKDAYWSINYVRVYQLVNPEQESSALTYIASEQPANAATNAYTAPNAIATPSLDIDTLCPKYNFSIVSDGKYEYEIACDFDPPGPDIIGDPYRGFKANSLADCLEGCSYLNEKNGTNTCGGVAHFAEINFCYFKKYIDGNLKYRPGYNQVRLIYYGYPQITDDPRMVADSTLTSSFIETIPTPQTYLPSTITKSTTTTTVSSNSTTTTTSRTSTIGAPPMGDNSTSTSSTLPPDYSETVTSGYLNSTNTLPPSPSPTASTDPTVTSAGFYITFNVDVVAKLLRKRAIQYLAFDNQGQSILVTSEQEAALFLLNEDGLLTSGNRFVALDSSVEPPRFSLSNDLPETPAKVNVDEDGKVTVEGVNGYCLTSSGELAVGTDSANLPEDCAAVEPELVAAEGNSTITTSSSMTVMTTTTMSMISMEGPSVSTTKTSSNGISSTQTSTISTASTTQPLLNDFVYAGCFGVPASLASLPGISAPFTDAAMTNEKCTAHCKETNAYFAGTYGMQCFCVTSEGLYPSLLEYPDTSCNKVCPGANRDICGGEVGFQSAVPTTSASRLVKRADVLVKRQSAIFLISLYNNTLLLGGPGETDVPSTTDTATETETVTIAPTGTDSSFPTDSVSYNVTGTNTATVISTTYVDVCHVCPGGLTTKATTITVPHCGCTASYDGKASQTVSVPSPVVPMLTTTKQCACGHGGAQSTVTVTVPHVSSIMQLASQLPLAPIVSPPVVNAAGIASIDVSAASSPDSADSEADVNAEPPAPAADDDSPTQNNLNNDSTLPVDAEIELDSEASGTADSVADNGVFGMVGINAAAAAPTSPASMAGPANTANPIGISNYTAPMTPSGNGTFNGHGPIEPFTSGASGLLRLRDDHGILVFQDKFALSFVLGVVFMVMAMVW